MFADKITAYSHGKEGILPGLTFYLRPRLRFGGSCFPKDVRALVACASDVGIKAKLLNQFWLLTTSDNTVIINKTEAAIGKIAKKHVGVLGLSFKANSDDIRESKSIELIRLLLDRKYRVHVHDPKAIAAAKSELSEHSISYEDDKQKLFPIVKLFLSVLIGKNTDP